MALSRFIVLIFLIQISMGYSQDGPDTKSIQKSSQTDDVPSVQRAFQLSIAYRNDNLEQERSGKNIDGNGVELKAGYDFEIARGFKITPQISTSVVSLNGTVSENDIGSYKTKEVGIGQRISYDIGLRTGVIKPFFDIGIGFGQVDVEGNVSGVSFDGDIEYSRLGVGVGVEYIIENKYAPYLRYSYSKLDLDEEVDVELRAREISGTSPIISGDVEDLSNKSVVLGIGYYF